ncbi:rna recognition motif [Stylonychia lemnae]|uniref:Rna recognition motif n=1 Tax=Stylonychia lemnae TaxID=5949 RepID=A0A078B3Q8_STYLE|nr:rna recognition motif [Stylonychia lemnae]|eukprot:CDW89175.1 rna recognition motif [Stylonychia lemnae]
MLRLFDRVVQNKKQNQKFMTWKEFVDVLISETLVHDNMALTEYFKNYQNSGESETLQRIKGLDLNQKRSMQNYIIDGEDKMMLEMLNENGEILMPIDKCLSHNEKTVLQRLTQVDKRTHKDGIQKQHFSHFIRYHCRVLFAENLYGGSILCLDQMCDRILMYDKQMKKSRVYLTIDHKIHNFDAIILDMAYSVKEQMVQYDQNLCEIIQLGVVMRDNSISFWSANDDFKYERKIESDLPNFQYQIWYLNSVRKWITTDKTNQLHLWTPSSDFPQSLDLNAHKEKIIYLKEVMEIDGFITSSLDKTFVVWDSRLLKMLFGASYEQNIRIYEFPNKFECNLSKILIGHQTMITAIELIDERNILISIDDSACLKCWSLNDNKCVQTYRFDYFIEAQALISINNAQFVSVSNRMHLFTILSINFQRKLTDYQFEDPYYLIRDFLGANHGKKGIHVNKDEVTKEVKLQDQVLDVMFSVLLQKVIVVNKKDVRIFNMQDGLQEMLMSKISNNDCELTFCTLEDNILVISDVDGRLYSIDILKHERFEIFPKCQSQIVTIKIDLKNHQIIVCEEYLNRIRVLQLKDDFLAVDQSKKQKQCNIVRELLNCVPPGDDLLQCYISLYLNTILVGNNNKQRVEVWNYDGLQ